MMDPHLPADPTELHEASQMARALVTDRLDVRLDGAPLHSQDDLLARLRQPDGLVFSLAMVVVMADLVGTALAAGAHLAAKASHQFSESEPVADPSQAEDEWRTKAIKTLWAGICADRSIANDGFQ